MDVKVMSLYSEGNVYWGRFRTKYWREYLKTRRRSQKDIEYYMRSFTLRALCPVIRMIKPRRMKWVAYVARMKAMETSDKTFGAET
jgi:hypothetical protein